MESIHVLLGGHDLENVKEEELELRAVVRMVKHPKFEPKTFNNDIAILQFDEPIPFSRLIGPVCLPQSGKSSFCDSQPEFIGKMSVSLSTHLLFNNMVHHFICRHLIVRYRICGKSSCRYRLGTSQRDWQHFTDSCPSGSAYLHKRSLPKDQIWKTGHYRKHDVRRLWSRRTRRLSRG